MYILITSLLYSYYMLLFSKKIKIMLKMRYILLKNILI